MSHIVKPNPEARRILEKFHNDIVDRRRSGELHGADQYAARWAEHASRIALIFHAGFHGCSAHLHELSAETAENAVRLAEWFSDQQLQLLAKGRRKSAEKLHDEVVDLFKRREGRNVSGHAVDYITARDVVRARIVDGSEAAHRLLNEMVAEGLLISEQTIPERGGRTTTLYRKAGTNNPIPG
jgi:hypothetical protein